MRNRRFRLLHLASILIVTLEALAGVGCPLTVWEDALRGVTRPQGLIATVLARVLYWDLPAWVFVLAYAVWATLTVATWYWLPPRRRV